MGKITTPYGAWPSPLSARSLAESGIRYGHLQQDEGNLYWLESQPHNNGRQTIMRYRPDSEAEEIIPAEYHVRTRVHEYGGGDFAVNKGQIIFANDADQRLYLVTEAGQISAITPVPEYKHQYRYADIHFHPTANLCVAVRETHPPTPDPAAVENDIVVIRLDGTINVKRLVGGDDFYAYPRISPDGKHIAWISWNHPDMPWDNTTLYRAEFDELTALHNIKAYMANEEESIYQPSWSPDGELYFVSDRSNWWNIYSLQDDILNAMTPMQAEFGFPMWQLGIRSYQFIDQHRIAAVITHDGKEQLCHVDTDSGLIKPYELPFCYYQGGLQLTGDTLYFIAASESQGAAVYRYQITDQSLQLISGESEPNLRDISTARSIYFPTSDSHQVHAFFYQPVSDGYQSEDEKPPLIVMIHGGPTGATNASYQPAIQFWTSRGFAVVDVNYRGSSGFGRAYRNSLRTAWGVCDVADCIAAVQYLIGEELVDPQRIAIRGGSAGGYTVYRALQQSKLFKAGVSRYGVADLTQLAKDTHKFELRYLDRLIGNYPEEADKYHDLSPINHSDKFGSPMLILQGDEDAVVPPQQSIAMAKALDEKGIPHQIVMLAGEQHGFRKKDNIVMALELELNFYRQVFAIESSEQLAELHLVHSNKLM